MRGTGTIVNVTAIIAAALAGCTIGHKIPSEMRDTLMKANAVSVMILGISGAISRMLTFDGSSFSTSGSLMMILSLAIGAILGELIHLESGIEKFGTWLKKKTGNAKDPVFVDAFVNASLTVCIGAMAIVGSIEDGISANPSVLYAKAILDFVIILVMSSTMGKGCGFSAVPVGILQGAITALASLLSSIITDQIIASISFVGSVLIFCVGINLLFGKKIKVGNLLPSLLVAALLSLFAAL